MTVLSDVKKAVGIHETNDVFDTDLFLAINSGLFELMQLGVVPEECPIIATGDEEWSDYLYGRTDMEAAKSYVVATVRLTFDRPETSYGIQSLEKMKAEWGWRLEIQARNNDG